MSETPTQLLDALSGSYRFDKELGQGGMATVYLAEDVKHRRKVAVKVLRPELAQAIGLERFNREIEICASLTHPHILMLIDSGEADGSLYYVMPYVEGESLRDRLDRERKLPVHEAIRIIDQVASALSYAHERGVVHRDIKPGNILLAGDQAIVADLQSFNPHDLDRALQYYQAALEVEPDYAPAYAGMSLIWGSKVVLGMVPAPEAGPMWRETADRAVELDPELAEGHQARAQGYTWFDFDWDRAEASYRRAIELDPNEPQARIFYAHFLAMLQRVAESDEQIQRALEIDPYNPFTQLMFGIQLGLTGRNAEAIEQLGKVPPNPLASFALAWNHFHVGDLGEGLEHYARYFELLGDEELASTLQDDGCGPRVSMVRGAEALVARSQQVFVKPNNMVHLFACGGDTDRATEWPERSYEMRDHAIAYMGALPTPNELRTDPRFHAFLEKLDLPVPEHEPR